MTTDLGMTIERTGATPVACGHADDMSVEYACYSDQGVRNENQDAVMTGAWAGPNGQHVTVLAVADGMGGYSGGQLAAKGAVRGFMDALIASFLATGDGVVTADWIAFLLDLYRQANIAVTSHAETYPELGTTLVTVVAYEGMFHVASVGDSRACLVRNGELRRMTRDDSLVQDLLDSKAITPEESENHPLLNIITRSLGPGERMDTLDVSSEPLLPGDLLVLATDGFWKPAERVIVEKSAEFSSRPLTCLAEELVEAAKRLESDDNISVALLRVATRRVEVAAWKTKTYWTNKEKENAETQSV